MRNTVRKLHVKFDRASLIVKFDRASLIVKRSYEKRQVHKDSLTKKISLKKISELLEKQSWGMLLGSYRPSFIELA